ncbi:MAG: UDP-N-acetylglucosamine 2-epimerase (non-hydrolyzing) [Firmicutes bacterium]|nr:UDP-N-acetylglucosamine 2-epimerase (non-hydrolyzing) [Bacillota bacterium]
MRKIKTFLVFGTRPEAIKMAPLVKELQDRKEFECVVCVTAQQREMLDQVLSFFKITPKYDLNIMKNRQTLDSITMSVLELLTPILQMEQPDIVLVHGDTTTSFAGALASFYEKITIGHVEAGLRTWNKYSPFPEEANRQMVDCISDMFFAPTEQSADNLRNEGKNSGVYITGNTAIDVLKSTVFEDYQHPFLSQQENKRIILLTAHRRENLGKPMENIFTAVKRIVDEYDDVCVIYPIHMNPAVREIADKILSNQERIKIIEPLDVFDFHNFIAQSYLVLTDSGGIQEEAPSLGKPVLVLRNTTERPEGVECGTLKLIGTDIEDIYINIKILLDNKTAYDEMSGAKNPYGDGFASRYIADAIQEYFQAAFNNKGVPYDS